MRKIVAISFLFMYMFSTTEIKQLLKIPIVFQHFEEHKQGNKTISFLHFLGMHYLHGSPVDKDFNRDMQLPFKTSNDVISFMATGFVPFAVQFVINKQMRVPKMKSFIYRDQFIGSPCLANIWQPPKSC